MSHLNNHSSPDGGNRQHPHPGQQLNSQYYPPQDSSTYDDDYDNNSTSAFQMHQHTNNNSSSTLTPQQRRQEERRLHGEMAVSASAAAAAAAAGTGASPWLKKQKQKSSRWKTIAWAVGALLLIALAGVLAWYFAVYKKNQSNGNASGSRNDGGTKNGGGGASGPTVVTPNGTVVPNTNYPLKRVFYGMAYVPMNAQLPDCYNTQQTVDDELQLLVQTTRRVRLYGTDCHVLQYTLDAIQRLKLDLKVVVGIWIDQDNTTYTRQRDEFFNVVTTYGWNDIIGVSVGNEVMFDSYQPLEVLMAHVTEVKQKVVSLGHPEIPVFTSDLESANRPPLTTIEDRAGVNLHPFFAGVPVEDAAAWFWKYLVDVTNNVNADNATPIELWITEVGWPTFPTGSNTNASIPSIPNLQTFVDTWLCDANAKGTPYYFFEFFDAPWKIWPGSAIEGFWGLLTIDKKLKIKLPDCLAS